MRWHREGRPHWRQPAHTWAGVTSFGLIAIAVASVARATAEGKSHGGGDRPNIILILADDLGYADIGCYGSHRASTPHLDRLATEGMRFTDFHSNGSMCSPTRAALLTGRYQQRTGIERALGERSEGLDRREVTIAERLHEAGYATAIFGKWHLGPRPEDGPTHHGFGEFRGHLHGAVDYASHVDRYGNVDWWHNDKLANQPGYNTTLITDYSVRFIEAHRDEPFFLYVPHSAIHFPWMTPDDKAYRQAGTRYTDLRKLGPHTTKNVGPIVRQMIEALDGSVGRLLATLREQGLDKRTFVFFTSDNGGNLRYTGGYHNISDNGPLRGQKGEMYEGGHRVPAIAWWPGRIQPGAVCDQTTITFDLFPTLLDLAGLGDDAVKPSLDGANIASVLFGDADLPKRTLFWRMGDGKAVRQGPWKLVVRGSTAELYNLRDDVGEAADLAAERKDLVNALQSELAAWENDVNSDNAKRTATSADSPRKSFTNSLGMTMVGIEPGSFTMGSTEGDWDESPAHEVTISRPFYIAATEVTNAQYEQFEAEHGKYRGIRGVSHKDNEAVVYVSWNDAVAFCRWLSEKESRPYRLPTEAEWEYACRAGTTTAFHSGQTAPEAYHRNQPVEGDWNTVRRRKDDDLRAKKGKVAISLAVGTMPPNAWGLHEMHGNVEEWVLDWYGPYPGSPKVDPVGPADGTFRVSRGGSHNTYVRHLRSANRHSTVPGDKHWLIGFRVVQAEMPETEPQPAVPLSMNDTTVDATPAKCEEPSDRPLFIEPIPFVTADEKHPHLATLDHHHCPTITWCANGDLLAAWYNTRSEIGREMVIVASRLRRGAEQWDKERVFFAPADRNTTGSCLLNDDRGRLYFFNAIGESSHHRDQCMVMSTSEDSGRTWTTPRIISSLDHRHKYTPMDSALVDENGTLVLGMDYAPLGHSANEAGSGVFLSPDRGATWIDRITGKTAPNVSEGGTDSLAAGFHINVVRLRDGRLMAMGRTGNINGHITQSYSGDGGRAWTYRESPFPGIGGGQRLVLMRLSEGPLLLVSFTDAKRRRGMTFTDTEDQEFTGYGMFAALSFDEGESWPMRKLLTAADRARVMDGGGNTGRFTMDATHAEPAGYLAATQTPDGIIHLISSRLHYRFNLAWLKNRSEPPLVRRQRHEP